MVAARGIISNRKTWVLLHIVTAVHVEKIAKARTGVSRCFLRQAVRQGDGLLAEFWVREP